MLQLFAQPCGGKSFLISMVSLAINMRTRELRGISTMRNWMIPVVLLFTALGSTSALADGITLNGSLYNVTFTTNIDNTFTAYAYNSPTIIGIITAIDSSLGSTPINDVNGEFYRVAGASGITATAALEPTWQLSGGNTAWPTAVLDNPGYAFWANFTPTTVVTPEPPTAPLALAGLG
jgi:hypothetical protein